VNTDWLLVVDLLVGAALVWAYLTMRRALATVAATTSDLPADQDPEDGDEPTHERDAEAERLTGVARRGRLVPMFMVLEVRADRLSLRSRPSFLGLHLIVPRADVDESVLVQGKGAAAVLALTPVSGRAEGLERLRFQLRGDTPSIRRALTRLGWLEREPDDRRAGRSGRSGRPGRSGRGGRTTAAKSKPRR
jgi:hypothetical protein